MSENDHEKLADELEREADRLTEHSEELEDQVKDARSDWERKRSDESVPGAPPPPGEDAEAPKRDETPPW